MSKAQTHLLEYVFMTLFIVIMIVILIFFLTGWQFSQLRATESKTEGEKALYIMKFFTQSPFFTKDESLFDDLKLDSFELLGDDACSELNVVFGKEWFADIILLDGSDSWSFCSQDKKNFTYQLPVNVYKTSEGTNNLALLNIGVYLDESPD